MEDFSLEQIKQDAIDRFKKHHDILHKFISKKFAASHNHVPIYPQEVHEEINSMKIEFDKAIAKIKDTSSGPAAKQAIEEVRAAALEAVQEFPPLHSEPCQEHK